MDAVRGLLDHGEFGEGLGDPGTGVGQLLTVTGIGGRGGRGRWGGAREQPQRGNEEQGFRVHEPGIPPVRAHIEYIIYIYIKNKQSPLYPSPSIA